MPKQRHRAILERALLGMTALFLLGGLIALGFLQIVSGEHRALLVLASSLGVIGCLISLLFINAFSKWLRKRIWHKAMAAWQASPRGGNISKYDKTRHLTEDGLIRFAIQIYSRMGYRILDGEDKGIYLRLVNPDGRIELLACKLATELIKLHQVYSLQLEMKRTKAVRGFFWAPAGFTSEAMDWAIHKPIILADQSEIGRLVYCAKTKGSRFLEY